MRLALLVGVILKRPKCFTWLEVVLRDGTVVGLPC